MKRTPLKRKRAKPRARGTACQFGRRCLAIGEYGGYRLCAKHMADRMVADAVKDEERCCRRCGSRMDLQWAHVFSRRYGSIRWERENSMALCAAHHYYFTGRPAEWESWCREVGVPWDELRERALTDAPQDALEIVERYREPVA